MEEATGVYERNNLEEDNQISLSFGSVPLTRMQLERLSESKYPISYQGGERLQVLSGEVDEWYDENNRS